MTPQKAPTTREQLSSPLTLHYVGVGVLALIVLFLAVRLVLDWSATTSGSNDALINRQIELKTLGINPRRAMEQIVEYKNDPGNGYTKTLLCFIQLFIVSNRTDTWYFANNNARHFAFDADERFLPVYQFAAESAAFAARTLAA